MSDEDGFREVAAADEIPVGRDIGVDGIGIAVFNADGDYYAISNGCAHQSAPLRKAGERKINTEHPWTETRGGNPESGTVTWPWHRWSRDLETGENAASGSHIATFDCRAEDGDVLVRI